MDYPDYEWHDAEDLLNYFKHVSDSITGTELAEKNPRRYGSFPDKLRMIGYQIRWDKGDDIWYFDGRIDVVPTSKKWQEGYYATEWWKAKRLDRLEKDCFSCCRCKCDRAWSYREYDCDLHVHHWEYHFFAEKIEHLMTFCQRCHSYIHDQCRIAFPRSVNPDVYRRVPGFETVKDA